MRLHHLLVLFLSVLVLTTSCKDKEENVPTDEPAQLELHLLPFFQNDTLELDSTVVLSNGFKMQVTDIKCYFYGLGNNGQQLKQAVLYNYREKGSQLLKVPGNYQDFPALSGYLGVTAPTNNADPSAFPNESDLNITNAGDMHWGWNPGYIFIKFEAKADTIPDGNDIFNHLLVYHIGTNPYISSLQFPTLNWQSINSKLHRANLRLHVNAIFDNLVSPIDIRSEYMTHSGSGTELLTEKFRFNFVQALQAQ